MPSYVAFLRAINLGPRRKFGKDELRACVESTGATGVETHLNTGNVLLSTRLRSRERVEAVLEEAFRADRGFEVPTIAYPVAELAEIAADVAELAAGRDDLERHYVLLLKEALDAATTAAVAALEDGPHRAVVRGRAVHLLLGPGYQDGKVDPLRVERHLGVVTNRNHTVVSALAGKWASR